MLSFMFLLFTGCTIKSSNLPLAPVGQIPLESKEPILLGETSAEECAAYAFGINWENLFSKRTGSIGFGSFSFGTPTRGMALHAALSKMPEATHAIQPRFDTTTKGWVLGPIILFGQQCTSVRAVGVKVR